MAEQDSVWDEKFLVFFARSLLCFLLHVWEDDFFVSEDFDGQ